MSAHVNGAKGAHVASLRALLGTDVVLLPIVAGQKRPAVPGWQKLTSDVMSQPDYLSRLASGNIGVLLGQASGHLCTIDVDTDQGLQDLLSLNPLLQQTLRTQGRRGANLWVRINGLYPKLSKIRTSAGDWGEWRADGGQTVIYGTHPEGMDYQIRVNAPPACIQFDQITWPQDLILPWKAIAPAPPPAPDSSPEDRLVQLYGEPFYLSAKGTIASVNESYWAGLLASENILIHVPEEEQFYRYHATTGLYSVLSDDLLKQQLSSRMLEASRQMAQPDLERKRTNTTLGHVISHLRGIVEHRGAFQRPKQIVHLANGVIELNQSAVLSGFSPQFFSRNRSPISFDPQAQCPRFLTELLLPAVHPDDVALLQKYTGMCLLGHNLVQRFLILDGPAERGKTQLANLIQSLVGRENVTQLRTRHLEDRFELARYLSKTLLVGVDVQPDFLSCRSASVIKGLVGSDWFDAERKNSNASFQFQGTFCLLVTSNTRLRVHLQGDLGAWKRRLLIVRYAGVAPKKRIPDFAAVLIKEEGPGILNWALQGLELLLQDVERIGDIELTQRQKDLVIGLLAESDSIQAFLEASIERHAKSDLTVAEIVEGYARFCPSKGWKPLPITEVHDQLEKLMLELFAVTKCHCVRRSGNDQRGFKGVKFK